MAKKRDGSSESSIQKRIKESRGSGRGSAYQPWITVRDFGSRGRSHRVFGHKSQRTHHLLSDLELAVFLLLEWNVETDEIREQFPLRRDETIVLAKNAGIKHPSVRGVKQVMSSDFLVNSSDALCPKFAIQAKYAKDFQDPHVIEKLELERRYWHGKSVPWMIVTDQEIPRTVFDNISWLYPTQRDEVDSDLSERADFYWYHLNETPTLSIIEVTMKLDHAYEQKPGKSLLEMRGLLAQRYFLFDITTPFRKLKGADMRIGETSILTELLHVSNQ